MVETRSKAAGNGEHRVRCLIWVPGGYDVPLELLEGLRQRNTVVREVGDAVGVMAALGAKGQGTGDRGQGGVKDAGRWGKAQVVVIVEPGVLRDSGRLILAVQRYHPGVKLWKYEMKPGAGKVALQPIEGKPGVGGERRIRSEQVNSKFEVRNSKEVPNSKFQLEGDSQIRQGMKGEPSPGPPRRISDLADSADLSLEGRGVEARNEEDQPLLSAEELAMLLGEGEEKQE